MMKYNYQGNANSPLGRELTISRKTPVEFVSRHDEHWVEVRTEQGDQGYVPATYVMVSLNQASKDPLDHLHLRVNSQGGQVDFCITRLAGQVLSFWSSLVILFKKSDTGFRKQNNLLN